MNWEKERHKRAKDEVAFWRNTHNSGFVVINTVEKDAPAFEEGKFQVEINTTHTLKTQYFEIKESAIQFARAWMNQNPEG